MSVHGNYATHRYVFQACYNKGIDLNDLFQNQIPGAQLAVMMAESMVPTSMLNWYNVFKASVIDR